MAQAYMDGNTGKNKRTNRKGKNRTKSSVSVDVTKTVKIDKAKMESALTKLMAKLEAFDNQTVVITSVVGDSAVSGQAVDVLGESLLKLASVAQEYSVLIRGFKSDILHYCENVSDMDKTVANQIKNI